MSKTITRRFAAKRPLRVVGITAVGAAAALALSSCASGVPALEDVWPEVTSSIENATSVAIDGQVTRDDQEVTVSMAGQIDDSSYSGNVAMDEANVQIIGNAEHTYMKPNTAFYESLGSAELQDMVGEKWLRMPAEQGGFTLSTFWEGFSEDIPTVEEFGASDYSSEVVELDGEEVYKYSGADGDSGEPFSVYVSKDDKLVRIEVERSGSEGSESAGGESSATPSASLSGSATGTGTGTVSFSQWSAVEPVEMPANNEVYPIPGT